MPLSPLWANLPRRKCDDCGKSYKPVKPSREGERGFCSATCRKSYHRHGGAYRKLRHEMRKMIERGVADVEKRLREIVREEINAAKVYYDSEDRPCGIIAGEIRQHIPRAS